MLFSAGDVLAQAIGGFEGGLDWQRIGRAAVFGGVLLGPMAHGHFNFLEYIVKRMAVRPTLQPFVKVLFDQVVYWAPFINTVYISFMYVASCMCRCAGAGAALHGVALSGVAVLCFACCQVTPPPPAQPPARALCEGADVQQRVQERLWPTLKANYILWPAAQVRKICTESGAILRANLSQPPNPLLLQIINFKFVPLQHQLNFVLVVSLGWAAYLSLSHSGSATAEVDPAEAPTASSSD